MHNNEKRSSQTPGAVEPHMISEMNIVDTFTKLIFGEVDDYLPSELLIIAALRTVENSVMRDTYQQMGAYLRELGVREMIELVGSVKASVQAGKSRTHTPGLLPGNPTGATRH